MRAFARARLQRPRWDAEDAGRRDAAYKAGRLELRRPDLDRQLVERAGEAERHLVVLVVDRRAGIDADVEGLVDRHQERNGMRDRLLGDLRAVDAQHALAALAEAGTIIGEVEDDGVLAGRQRLLARPPEALQPQQIVGEDRLALEQVEAVAAEAAARA